MNEDTTVEATEEERPPVHPVPRKARRKRKRAVAKAYRKGGYQDPRGELAIATTIEDQYVYYLPGSEDPLPLGDPLQIHLVGTHEDGYHVLDESTDSMLIARSTWAKVTTEWGLTEAAWVRSQGWRDVLEVSHSEGVLLYSMHPLAWPEEGPDPKYLLAHLIGTKGPSARAPKDRPRPVAQPTEEKIS